MNLKDTLIASLVPIFLGFGFVIAKPAFESFPPILLMGIRFCFAASILIWWFPIPSTAAIKALKKLNIKKIYVFTPYSKKLNDEVLDYFKSEGFEITSNSYFDIEADYDIGKVDQNYLYDVLSKIDLNGAEALFVSCTALPVLPIIDKLEKKLNTVVLSSNQALIWDTLVQINKNNSVEGFGKLFNSN